MEMLENGLVRYVQMRLRKLKLREFAKLSKISKSVLGRWRTNAKGATLSQAETMADSLACPLDVVLGRQPCLKKCSHCEQSQP